jgi:hypothetical protein
VGQQDEVKKKKPAAATPATARGLRLRSMRHISCAARRLRDNRHAGLCGVAMSIDHVMIVQLV